MATEGSITREIRGLEAGHQREEAARALWDRFYGELVRHALKKLRAMHANRRVTDEEDAAARAFTKVCRGIESGQLKLDGRVDLRRLLLKATEREAVNQLQRQRRDGQEPLSAIFSLVPGEAMSPELNEMMQEGCRRLLDLLDDELLRRIALWKLVGHTNPEIAQKLGCSLAKVERKLGRIRARWSQLVPERDARGGRRDGTAPTAAIPDLGGTTVILNGFAGRS